MADTMRDRYLDKETEKVYKEYSEFLDAAGLPYNNNQNGFHVCLEMKNIRHSFTQVCRVHNGEIMITDYCGNCYTGVRKANRVAKAIRADGAARSIGMPGTGKDRYFRIKNLFMENSLRKRQVYLSTENFTTKAVLFEVRFLSF